MQYGSPQTPGQYAPYPQMTQYIPPPKKKTKKRLAIVAAVSAACLASAGVYATTLTVTANKDAAGTTSAILACDSDGVNVTTSDPVWDDLAHKYYFAKVTVTGISPDCDGQKVFVQPLTTSDAALGGGGDATFDKDDSGHATDVEVTLTGAKAYTESYLKAAVAIHEPAA